MSTHDATRTAIHVALAYFAFALAVTWITPVWGGLFLGIGATLGMQALAVMFVVRAASVPNRAPEKGDPESKSSISSDSSDPNDALPHIHDEDAAHHRGWLVLVWASVAPVPPEKPEKGERAFAELVNGELRLRRERGGDVVARVDLTGCDLRLCRAPGKWDDTPPGDGGDGLGDLAVQGPGLATLTGPDSTKLTEKEKGERKRHGAGAEKRWWKRLPIVVSHKDRALHRGHRVLWCYALSDAAKEAWVVALHKILTGARCGENAHARVAALAATSRARSLTRDFDSFAVLFAAESKGGSGNSGTVTTHDDDKQKARSSSDASDVAWAAGGAAGAAINALASRIFFDMQRSPEKIAEVTEQLASLCSGIPDLPKFVGPISVSNVSLGKNTPQVLAARLPPTAKPGRSAAPWDGGSLANRGACSAAELDVDFGGTAEMTLTTYLNLSVYAEMMAGDDGIGDGGVDPGTEGRNNLEEPVASTSVVAAGSTSSPSAGGAEQHIRRLKSLAKKNASKLIGAVARKLESVPISMTVKIKKLSGTLRVWIPPPPGDRLWFGFVEEPCLEMECVPTLGAVGIKWHGLAEKVSGMITANLKKEIHAALVLPNAGNIICDPLSAFHDVQELSVKELLELGKGSQAFMRDRGVTLDAVLDADSKNENKEHKKSFHTPRASLAEEMDAMEIARGISFEDDPNRAEEAVVSMVDSFLSVGSGDETKHQTRTDETEDPSRDADDEWTSPAPVSSGKQEKDSPPTSPTSPGGSRLIDFHFGKPFPDTRVNTKPASVTKSQQEVPGSSGNLLENKFKRLANVFAAKAAKARADVSSVHQGVLAGGMKGGLDVAKSIANRTTVSEVKKDLGHSE